MKSIINEAFWQSLDWDCHRNIKAVSTLKHTSAPLNFSLATHCLASREDLPAVLENRRLLQQQLGLSKSLVWLQQTHGIEVLEAKKQHIGLQADAAITCAGQEVACVLTADCLPVFIADKQGQHAGVIHAGWRGLLSGVIERAVQAMPCRDIQAYLGPAIGPDVFEVGHEVREAFINEALPSEPVAGAFVALGNNKYLADLYHLARLRLARVGVMDVKGATCCTVRDACFFSYRQGDHHHRMAHLIWVD